MITHSVIYILWSLLYYTTFERYGQLGESVLAITWHIYREENCIFFPSAKSSGMICLYKSDIWHRTLWLIFPTDSGMIIIQENVRISLLQIICYWGGVVMATTSITKEFFVKDQKAFERMRRDLDKEVPVHKMVAESASLKKSKEKLATFVFR